MDVTHIPAFGKPGFVHVVIETYSDFIQALAQSGKKFIDVKNQLLEYFFTTGKSKAIKTDNRPVCTAHSFQQFCAM